MVTDIRSWTLDWRWTLDRFRTLTLASFRLRRLSWLRGVALPRFSFFIGASPPGAKPLKFLGQHRRGRATASHQAAKPLLKMSWYFSCRAFSASEFTGRFPGAMPQAVAFRTFGAGRRLPEGKPE